MAPSDIQHEDFEWFKSEMPSLYGKLGRCFVAIKGKQVIGVYGSLAEGFGKTRMLHEPGTFIVQEVGPDESAYTATIAGVRVP